MMAYEPLDSFGGLGIKQDTGWGHHVGFLNFCECKCLLLVDWNYLFNKPGRNQGYFRPLKVMKQFLGYSPWQQAVMGCENNLETEKEESQPRQQSDKRYLWSEKEWGCTNKGEYL